MTSIIASLSTRPRIYLGTMTFGWNQASSKVDDSVARGMVERFVALGGRHVDTARIYSGGDCEPMVGRSIKGVANLIVGTKAAPSDAATMPADQLLQKMRAAHPRWMRNLCDDPAVALCLQREGEKAAVGVWVDDDASRLLLPIVEVWLIDYTLRCARRALRRA